MTLTPRDPPGRRTRKARGYGDDIRALREQGYTFMAIREALADAGVVVSKSTVQRECGRLPPIQRAAAPVGVEAVPQAKPLPVVAPHRACTVPGRALPADSPGVPAPSLPLRGRAIAEAFVSSHITNPLLKNRSTP